MFVKVVKPNVVKVMAIDKVVKYPSYERTIQCDDFSIEDQGDAVFVECKPDKGFFHVEKKPGFAVYVLNDQGDTIHTYRWDKGR